jgi:hypothetical protein
MFKILLLIHHIAGIIGSLLVLFLSITGILLNHRSLIGYATNTTFGLQKLIFGLHSGNVGNTSIVWLTDLGAICMILLSITGIWMWVRLIPKKRRTKR